MLIAQITDLHVMPPGELLQGHVDTGRYLEMAVAKLQALNPTPDVLLISGDLVEGGTRTEYDYLRRLLAPLKMPTCRVVHRLPPRRPPLAGTCPCYATARWSSGRRSRRL